MAPIRRRVLVSGMVQGVFFRAYTRDVATSAGVTGWVRNLPDGNVEAVFEGELDDVSTVVEWCHRGSPGSRVERVEIFHEEPRGEYESFKIAYGRGGLF